ncbi:hypothetical protein [Noviherbaspirillum suwonense]|uniref:hypothetical protein n=1 Tax=Noviherbaspirillum suwonense TaxID=1224511 RepID=UPI0024B82163|nr:hypothetical protein [Noviherbaspirillum suwonense]
MIPSFRVDETGFVRKRKTARASLEDFYNCAGKKTLMKTPVRILLAAGAASTLLGGCVVYSPPPVYGGAPYSYYPPAPVYAAPPVSFGLNFGYRGGGGHHHR